MSADIEYSLKNEQILEDKYVIKGCLGAGGFGITYLAENLDIGTKYAIKELFPKHMVRRGEDGVSVLPLYAEQDEWNKQLQSFFREAKILGKFAEEEAITRVYDYFRANGTAYMVMEYLDGSTLFDIQKAKGPQKAEDIFRKMIPVADSLSRLHASGLIHRDISPENLMEVKDGSVKLMDFGSATEYSSMSDRMLLLKEGFAPPEQYASDGSLGPWTDLYAFCASIYYCITGITPVSSISRVFADDLKKPSALGIGIDPRLEEILMRGMDPDWSARYPDMESFLAAVRRILPEPNTAETGEKRRKHAFISGIMAALICAAVLLAGFMIYQNRARIMLSRVPVVNVQISPADDAGAVDFSQAADMIRKRLDIFAGKGRYLWQEDHGSIYVTLAQDVLNEKGTEYAFRSYLCAPMHLSLIMLRINAGQLNNDAGSIYSPDFLSGREIPVQNEWIRDAALADTDPYTGAGETDTARLQIFLTEEGAEALKEYTQTDNQFPMTFSTDPFFCVDAKMTGDLNSFILEIPDTEENYVETVRYALSSGGFEKSAAARCEFQTDWENAGGENRGEYQCGAEDFEGDTVTLEYRAEDYGVFTEALYDEALKENDLPGKTLSMLVLKQRLDSLKIPYAVGFSQSDSSVIHLRFPKGSITRLEGDMLFTDNDLRLQSTWLYVDKTIYNSDTISFRYDDGKMIMEDASALKDLPAENFNTASKNGDTLVGVFLGGKKIGSFSAKELETGPFSEISFPAPLYEGTGTDKEKHEIEESEIEESETEKFETEKSEALARLLTAVLKKDYDSSYNLNYFTLCKVEYRTQDGEIDWTHSLPEELPDLTVTADTSWKKNLEELVQEKGGELQLRYEDTNSVRAYIRLSNLDREDLASAGADILKAVWNDPGCGVSRGELNQLEIDCTENTGGRHAEGNYTVRLILQKKAETHRMEPEQPEVYRDTSDWMYDSVMVTDETDPVRSTVTDLFADGADMFTRHSAVDEGQANRPYSIIPTNDMMLVLQ